MTNEVMKNSECTLDDIRNIVTGKSATSTGTLTLTEIIEDDKQFTKTHNNLLQDINKTLNALTPDTRSKRSTSSIRSVIKKLKKRDEGNTSQECKASTSLEELVISLLEPKIQQWLNDNLARIVHDTVEKKIKKIIDEEDE